MHSDVYSSLGITWYVYIGICTWHIGIEEGTPLVMHACILMSKAVLISYGVLMWQYTLAIVDSYSVRHL